MPIETALRDHLLTLDALATAVGQRIRPLGAARLDHRPYLTYQVTERVTSSCLDGTVDDYRHAVFEIGIFADRYDEVMAISDLVRDRLDQYGGTVASTEFAPIWFDGESDIEEATPEDEDEMYLRIQTYRTLFREIE